MVNRYYEANTCYYMSSRQRRRILRARIRLACNAIIWVCAFSVLGIMGSVDLGNISLAQFFAYEAINAGILLTSIWVKANIRHIV